MATAARGEMLHVGMGPSPLREPLDRPRPRPVRPVPSPPAPGRRAAPARRALPQRAARRRARFLLFAGAVVGLLVLALVSAQALVAQSAFRAQDLTARVEQLRREQAYLRLRAAELQAPGRLQRAAAALGLVFPEEVHLVRTPTSSGGETPGSAASVPPDPSGR